MARRFTNVVLARRSVVGSSSSARDSATFSSAIAPAVALALRDQAGEVVAALGDRGHRARGVHEEARQRALVLGDLVGEHARGRQQRVEVLGRLADLLALALVLRGEALDDVLQVAARLLVDRVEDLVEVDDRGRRGQVEAGAVVELLVGVGRERERDVAVGDARQRGEPDHGAGALAQRRVGLLDLDLDGCEVVVGELDRAHGADPPAADLHVVVLDELARRLEHERVLVAAAAAEQQQVSREEDRQDERGQRDAARCGQSLLLVMGPSPPSPASPPRYRVLLIRSQDGARYPSRAAHAIRRSLTAG